MLRKKMPLCILLITECLSIKYNMKKNYINLLLKKFPNIANGRRNFKYFDFRIKKSLILTYKYKKKANTK